MKRFLLRRMVLFLLALWGLSALIFCALRILPGDVATIMAGTKATPARVEALRAELGLNRPALVQYGDWLVSVLHGDFGVSVLTGRPMGEQVVQRASVTVPLIVMGMALALAIGVPLGCVAVLAHRAWVRVCCQVVAIVGGAIPALWGGMLVIVLFGRGGGLLNWLPSQGFAPDGWHTPLTALSCLLLPALSVGVIVAATVTRYTRSSLISMLDSGYVAMARACGMSEREALLRVGLRLSAAQLVSVIGLTFAQMITGVMVVENLFALPGLGSGLVTDVGNRDLLVVQSELLLLAAVFLAIGVLVDVAHRLLDPRLRDGTGDGQ